MVISSGTPIETVKKEQRNLHVVFLDLAKAFGSVAHKMLCTAFDFFNISRNITELVKTYFQDLFCVNTTTTWQNLEIGIMAGCTISPLAFTIAMKLIIPASRWVVGGERSRSSLRLPPIWVYMDDLTTIAAIKSCTRKISSGHEWNSNHPNLAATPLLKVSQQGNSFTSATNQSPQSWRSPSRASNGGTMQTSRTPSKWSNFIWI